MVEKTDPLAHLGQRYEQGILPYGGAVDCRGRIAYVVSEEEHRLLMRRLKRQ